LFHVTGLLLNGRRGCRKIPHLETIGNRI
jgi:hypothetical protein